MNTEKRESSPIDPVRELYGAYRELEAVRRAASNNLGVKILTEMEEKREIDLHQRLIDFFLNREEGVGIVKFQRYKTATYQEKTHVFSRNKFSLTLPNPLNNEDTFAVEARLSDLRRPGVVNSSIKAKQIIALQELTSEFQSDFIIRTFEELADSEKYRLRKLASNLNADRSQLAPLKDLQEHLIIGRLMAISQLEDIPGLRVGAKKSGGRINTWAYFQDLTFSQDFNDRLPRSPQEHKDILRNAGLKVA